MNIQWILLKVHEYSLLPQSEGGWGGGVGLFLSGIGECSVRLPSIALSCDKRIKKSFLLCNLK